MHRVILLAIFSLAGQAQTTPSWKWVDRFSSNEQRGLTNWIKHAESGITSLFGPLPYNYRVYFHRMENGNGPAPWAHTNKGLGRAVHFHVNTYHSWKTFEEDWTAPHELSHLMFPYLGENSIWFAERIASYLQYQIMYANKTITWQQGTSKLQERFNRARMYRDYDDMSIVELSKIVRDTDAYVRLYWGGAAYFINVDKRLYEEKKLRLNDVIREYLRCCNHQKSANADSMMRTFNRLAETKVFTEVYKETVSRRGFPFTQKALAWLKDNPPNIQADR